jgi:hypothetical protein
MGLGWHISLHRQASGRRAPSADGDPKGDRLAVWQSHVYGLDWLKELVEAHDAVHLSDNAGYPVRYTVRAGAVIPIILDGPPRGRTNWMAKPSDVVGYKHLRGGATIDQATLEECQPDEWPQVEAWDES